MGRQFVLLLGSRVTASLLQAVLFALLARNVSPAVFGLVAAVTGVVGVVLVATGAGQGTLVSRAHAQGRADEVASAVRLTWVSGLLTAVVLALALGGWAALADVPAALVLIALALTVERTTDAALNVPIADGRVLVSGWPVLARRAVAVGLLVAALAAGLDALWSYAGAMLVGAVVAQLMTQRLVPLAGRPTVPWRTLVRTGAPYMWNTVAAQSRMLDTAVVAAVLTPAAAGAYAAASKLVQPVLLVPQTIASLVLPRAARVGVAASRRMVRPLLLAGVASLVVVIPLALVAPWLLVLVMGEQYASSADTFRVLLVGMPFVALSAPLAAILQGQDRARLAAVVGVVFAVVLLVGVAVGAAVAGPEGAAAGLSASFVARSLVLVVAALRVRPADPGA
ncbi:lipopolysaccharide biosynthesis protein [Cellulomonas sp. S1-8]|uniref:lipopolysaccharide biosynthesis protein n=1 Tax=Cellulomonas sp. S1-8 TaxID=2904790 RepID=UPI002243291D|nr:oligosaccharide flippase family protein [Cellulomonas sp. S1-8]UZN04296.1 oligosaccharide flippase family protein [Cellulomonas sp. S1-8]